MEEECVMRLKSTVFVLLIFVTGIPTADAYIGPGLGAGTLGVILGVIGSVFLAIFAVLWYPIKRVFKKIFKPKRTDHGP